MALAEEIAQNDPFGMRIVKLSVNQAQDAMGFRTAVTNAHARYMLLEIAGLVRAATDERQAFACCRTWRRRWRSCAAAKALKTALPSLRGTETQPQGVGS